MSTAPEVDQIITRHLNRLLGGREYPKTICPSEAARALTTAELAIGEFQGWRDAMPTIRNVVGEMRSRGEVEVMQTGSVLEGDLGEGLEGVKGPIRVRMVKRTSRA